MSGVGAVSARAARIGLAMLGLMSLMGLGLASVTAVGPAAAAPEEKIVAAGKLKLAGRTMRCGRTPTLVSRTFWDYGGSGRGRIILNPDKLAGLSDALRLYVYAHECGHQIYGASETKADCYAVRRGRKAGWLTQAGLEEICHFFKDHPGGYAHPPGPERCAVMIQCFKGKTPHRASR